MRLYLLINMLLSVQRFQYEGSEEHLGISKTKWVAIKILGLLELGCIAQIYHSFYLIKV
jgi:hypothetical protein